MAVNLQKGQKVDLRKANGSSLKRVMVGLGWDPAPKSGFLKSFFGKNQSASDIDIDTSAFVCANGKITGSADVVFFGNLTHYTGAVRHMGDNLTGDGEGDDEQIFVDLENLPTQYNKVIFVVNIYHAKARKQHFGLIENAFIRICDSETNEELCRYNLSEKYENMTSMVFGEIYLYNGDWKFNAIGQGTTDGSIEELVKRFV